MKRLLVIRLHCKRITKNINCRNREISDDMRRRLNIITAILMILAILFASCSPSAADGDSMGTAGEDRTRTETKEPVKSDKNGDVLATSERPCGGRAFSPDLAENEIMLDVLPEGDGYRLLTGTPHDFGEENSALSIPPEKIRTESNLALYDSRYRMLDAGFRPTGESEPTAEEMTFSEFREGEDRYRYVCTGYEIENGAIAEVSFALMKGEKTFCNLATMRNTNGDFGFLPHLSWAEKDGVLFTLEKTGSNPILRRDGFGLERPDGDADGTLRGIMSVGEVGETVYAIVGEAGGSLEEEQAYLAPLEAETTKIGIEGQRMEVCPDYEGIMASAEGKTAFLRGSNLYLLEEDGLYHLTDLALYGVGPESLTRRILILPDDRLLVLTADTIISLTVGEEETESLTLGVIEHEYDYEGCFEREVAVYNRTGRGLPVKIRYFDDIAKLNLALLSGEIDLIGSREIVEMRNYADRGILLALEDADTVLLKEGELIPSVVESAKWKGKTFFLPGKVFFWYAVARKSDVQARGPVVTASDYMKMVREVYPDHMRSMVGIDFYDSNFSRDLDQWIDWEKGTCHFDDGSFAEFLTFCGDCAKDVDEAVANLIERWCTKIWGTGKKIPEGFVEKIPRIHDLEYEQSVLFPYPSTYNAHHGGSAIEAQLFYGIVTGSERREEALRFMEYMLLEVTEPDGIYVSVAQKAIEKVIEEYLEEYRRVGEETGTDFSPLTDQTVPIYRSIVAGSYGYLYTENEIMKVMREEALRFFAGELTAEKAAEYMQNRISIYLAEQG